MKEILLLSGKGGTGKTTICAALAALWKEPKVLADADVDASNLPLLLAPRPVSRTPFFAGWEPVKEEEKCTGCGLCREKCRFGAIGEDLRINPLDCEGCGVCAWFCPEKALSMREKEVGEIFVSETPYGPLVHAELYPGEENSGKLVVEVKRRARALAEEKGINFILIDGSPGVGCPVIASLSGVSLCLLVAEPTVSGLHDFRRLAALLKHFRIPGYLIVNKADLAPELTEKLLELASIEGFVRLGSVPYDPEVFEALRAGRPLPEVSRGPARKALLGISNRFHKIIFEEENHEDRRSP